MPLRINIVANTIIEPGMSGGNRIFVESAKRWIEKGIKIRVFTSNVGKELCCDNGLNRADFKIWNLPFKKEKFSEIEIIFLYVLGIVKGSLKGLRRKLIGEREIIYSSSDFWPDSIPALLMKIRNKKIKWIAGFYLFAAPPWQKDSPYKGKGFLIGLLYYLSQMPIYWIIKKYADLVFVTSEPDVEKFVTKKRGRHNIIVIRGGIDIKPSTEFLQCKDVIPLEKRKYDACFVGRFHYQKGVLELVNIWNLVCKQMPDAKLAMIGIGPLEKEVGEKIKSYGLGNNIELLGFRDGADKYKIFKQSKIVAHPATYDSGGMAAAEAMAWGLPGVSFDLEALRTYYPKGMVKVSRDNCKLFAKEIIQLLQNDEHYKRIATDARNLILEEWDWNKRAKFIHDAIQK